MATLWPRQRCLYGELRMRLTTQLRLHVYCTSMLATLTLCSDWRAFIEYQDCRKNSQPSNREIFTEHPVPTCITIRMIWQYNGRWRHLRHMPTCCIIISYWCVKSLYAKLIPWSFSNVSYVYYFFFILEHVLVNNTLVHMRGIYYWETGRFTCFPVCENFPKLFPAAALLQV